MKYFFIVFFAFFVGAVTLSASQATAQDDFEDHFYKVIKHEPGAAFPDLEYMSIADNPVYLKDWTESEYYLINIWAVWCAPCIAEIPSLQRLQKSFSKDKMRVMFVSFDDPDNGAELRSMMKKAKVPDIKTMYMQDDRIWDFMPVNALPITFLVSRNRDLLYTFIGDAPWDRKEAEEYLKQAMNNQHN